MKFSLKKDFFLSKNFKGNSRAIFEHLVLITFHELKFLIKKMIIHYDFMIAANV